MQATDQKDPKAVGIVGQGPAWLVLLDPAGGLTGPWLLLLQGLLARTVKKTLTTAQETGARTGAPVWMA